MGNRLQREGSPRPPTIRDIAREAGVSVATISRVLNGRAHVAPETRELVLRVIRERGFSRNRSARALSGGRTGLVGVMLPLIHASYFSYLAASVADALYERDLRAILCPTRHEHEREVNLLDLLLRGTTEGAVLILPTESSEELLALERSGYPFVVLDPRMPLGDGVASVAAANTPGARQAVQHLLELGHRRIGAVLGPRGWCATEERLLGYHAALASAGVLPEARLEQVGDFEIESGRAAAGRLLDLSEPPTAIFAFNDNMAIGTQRAARERGLRLPRDLSLIGFDDSEQAALVTPALTSVRQPLAEMGRMAVILLSRLLEGQVAEGLKVELETRLVVRESTAPPRERAGAARAAGQAGARRPLTRSGRSGRGSGNNSGSSLSDSS